MQYNMPDRDERKRTSAAGRLVSHYAKNRQNSTNVDVRSGERERKRNDRHHDDDNGGQEREKTDRRKPWEGDRHHLRALLESSYTLPWLIGQATQPLACSTRLRATYGLALRPLF